ncbi:LysR family transcriptional regulator ArgP [Rhizobium helianthi]|uniref:LysR family transcriptional regulator ArgP n=1 Tax=Rhizobium helianthi TaxID=1132695 RepID=A0ABW4M9F7_9HYPH
MLDYAALQAVAFVVREGSFEKAARLLGVTPSAVSQRIKALEERLGTILIIRGQPCTASLEGQRICRHVEDVMLLEGELSRELPALPLTGASHSRITLPIAVNADSLATWFLPAVSEFSRQTSYLFDLLVDDQDHTAELLRTGRALAAVTANAEPVQGYRSFPLGHMRYRAVASPDFVRQWFPQGPDAHTLSNAPALIFNRKDNLQDAWVRLVTGGSVNLPSHWLPSSQAFIDGSLLGMGWGMNPEYVLRPYLETGRLVELSPAHAVDVPLYWQIRAAASRQLAQLTERVKAFARSNLNNSA